MGILADMMNDRDAHARIIARMLLDHTPEHRVALHLREFARLDAAVADRVAREASLT